MIIQKGNPSLIIALYFVLIVFIGCKHKVEILPNDEIYTCPNHVHTLDDHPAKCPKDGIELIKMKITEEQRQMLKDGDYDKAKE